MYIHDFQIVFQEVPGQISLCFYISGCPLRCKGCHSPFLFKEKNGTILTTEYFENTLEKYKDFGSCVLFMGGEWHENELEEKLKTARNYDYETCLYTGQEKISEKVKNQLTWLKTGPWNPSLGVS